MPQLPPLIAIVGPTAAGKTALACALAQKFSGEIVSADSRLIYREMDIATGKLEEGMEKYEELGQTIYRLHHIPIHLMDLVAPHENFSVAQFKQAADLKIQEIYRRKALPILVGGTGLYVDAVTENFVIPPCSQNPELRKKLSKLDARELFLRLEKVDPQAARTITPHNPRKLIRALEVWEMSGQKFSKLKTTNRPLYETLKIAPRMTREILYEKIDRRVDEMLRQGLIVETETLRKKYSPALPALTGIGYREIGEYLEKRISLEEAMQKIKFRTHHYARRQLTWFRKDPSIHWVENYCAAESLIEEFIKRHQN